MKLFRLSQMLILLPAGESWVSSPPFIGVTRTHRHVVLKSSREDLPLDRMGLNELQTLLRTAVQNQDFTEAAKYSDVLLLRLSGDDPPKTDEEKRIRRRRMSWRGLGAAPWLVDRLDALNYTFPTTIQINAMEAVNAILNNTDEIVESTSLEERIDMNNKDMGIVISGTTGSGKTLAYLVPLLSTLSDSLFARQRIRVGAEENVGDTTGDLLERVALVTSPVVRSSARSQIRQGGAIATGAALSTLGKSGKDVKSPLALIVVPTRELGVQTALLLYELVGGSVKKSATAMPGKANMFKYKGPKGIKIACVLDDDEASFGLKLQTDIAVTLPQYVTKLMADDDIIPSKLRVIIFDEADLALEETKSEDLAKLFDDDHDQREYTRLTFLVGASVTESLGNLAVRSRILPEGKSYIATATRFAQLQSDEPLKEAFLAEADAKTASLKDLNVCLDPGLRHERVVVANNTGLLVLTRLLRKELGDYEQAIQSGENAGEVQRPRVVVFFPDEAEAKASIESLRDAMWGRHKLCVLLPKTGVNPLRMMEQFKNNETTVMLATPNSVRGLDFPALTHVYTLHLPMDDPREYVHLAGRVGRVGQTGSVAGSGGRVISILKDDEAEKMSELARELGFQFTDVEPIQDELPSLEAETSDLKEEDIDKLRRYLEDKMTLLGTADDPEIDPTAIVDTGNSDDTGGDDDDESDGEDDENDQPYQ